VVVFAVVFSLSSGKLNAQDVVPTSAKASTQILSPEWTVKLAPYLNAELLGRVVGHGHETHAKPRTSLWFLDDDTVSTTFVTANPEKVEPKLSSRSVSNSNLPLRLRGIFLDTKSGKIRDTQIWPTESRFAGIVAAYDGNFVTQKGNEVTLFSSTFKEMQRLELPVVDDGEWESHTSPTGRSILFIATNLKTRLPVRWIWIRSDDLSILRSWEEIQSGWVEISDKLIAMTSCVWFYDCLPNIQVKGLATDWRTVAPSDRHHARETKFVNDDLIFFEDAISDNVRLVHANTGKVVFTQNVLGFATKHEVMGPAYSSAGGQRFIVPIFEIKGPVNALDIGGRSVLKRIFLFDAPFHGLSYVINLKPTVSGGEMQFALSPDGLDVAILDGESLQLFKLPALH